MTTLQGECFGKLPLHGDFIRHRAGADLQDLDRWVQAGLMATRGRADWAAAWQDAPPSRFLRVSGGRVLAGVLVPSRDSAGRDYPFMVACVIDDRATRKQPALAPLLAARFLDAAEALARRAWPAGSGYREVQAAVDGLAGDADVRDAERRLSALLDEPYGRSLEEDLGAFDDRGVLLLANAASLLGPRSRPRFALTLPGRGDDAHGVARWLAVVAAVRGGADRFPPLVTWSAARPESGVRLLLTEPAGEHFLPLVLRHLPSDACDLAGEGLDSASLMQKARERFGALAQPGLRLADLAAKLAQLAR